MADALVAPDFKDAACWTPPSSRSASTTARSRSPRRASRASYGYDVRGEVFGSAGMVTAGTRARHRHDALRRGRHPRRHRPQRHRPLHAAYAGEIAAFAEAVRDRRRRPRSAARTPAPRWPIALAAIESVETAHGGDRCERSPSRSAPRWSTSTCRSLERVKRIPERGLQVEIWDWTAKDIDALAATGATFSSMTGYLRGRPHRRPTGSPTLLATAEESLAVAERLGLPAPEPARHRPRRPGPAGAARRRS